MEKMIVIIKSDPKKDIETLMKADNKYSDLTDKEFILLEHSNWDDYGFKTSFNLKYYDNSHILHEIGSCSIANVGMGTELDSKGWCSDNNGMCSTINWFKDNTIFLNGLTDEYISLAHEDFYKILVEEVFKKDKYKVKKFCESINDIAFNSDLLEIHKDLTVVKESLMRGISYTEVINKLHKIVRLELLSNEYKISFHQCNIEVTLKRENDFTNNRLYAIIGSNGSGKTSLLKELMHKKSYNSGEEPVNVVYCSFSAFDSIDIESDLMIDRYQIISLEYSEEGENINTEVNERNSTTYYKTINARIGKQFEQSISNILYGDISKRNRFLETLELLFSNESFRSQDTETMSLFKDVKDKNMETTDNLIKSTFEWFEKLSSGHKIILLTTARLVELVEEKTLLLFDEPELHLHPPLISTLLKVISYVMRDRNGFGILTTHSPVVLQEIYSTNVYKLNRFGNENHLAEVKSNTYGESISAMIRDIFFLEYTQTQFYEDIKKNVNDSDNIDAFLGKYSNKLGMEGISIALNLFAEKREDNNE